jgi:hypothetical protein
MTNNRRIVRRLLRLAPAILIAAVAACAPVRRGGGAPPATLVFTNDALYQAAVYIVVPGVQARRVGTVMPGQTDTLVVPTDLSTRGGTVNIVARLLNRSPQTGPVSILTGEQYVVRLTNDTRVLSFLPAPQP